MIILALAFSVCQISAQQAENQNNGTVHSLGVDFCYGELGFSWNAAVTPKFSVLTSVDMTYVYFSFIGKPGKGMDIYYATAFNPFVNVNFLYTYPSKGKTSFYLGGGPRIGFSSEYGATFGGSVCLGLTHKINDNLDLAFDIKPYLAWATSGALYSDWETGEEYNRNFFHDIPVTFTLRWRINK